MASSQNLQSFASVSSVRSQYSLGNLPSHMQYMVKSPKAPKPYGISFVGRMNRTHRGPGKRYLKRAAVWFAVFILFLLAAILYMTHRNIQRLIVLRTEVFAAIFMSIALIAFSMMGRNIYKARVESNKWRKNIRFAPEGLYTVVPVDFSLPPKTSVLYSGTYGPKALKSIPKPKAMNKVKVSAERSAPRFSVIKEEMDELAV